MYILKGLDVNKYNENKQLDLVWKVQKLVKIKNYEAKND